MLSVLLSTAPFFKERFQVQFALAFTIGITPKDHDPLGRERVPCGDLPVSGRGFHFWLHIQEQSQGIGRLR